MSQVFIYRLILLACLLLGRVGTSAGHIPMMTIRNYRGMTMENGSLYLDQVLAGSECALLLSAAQDELGRQLEMSEIHAEIAQLRKQFPDSFRIIPSSQFGSQSFFRANALGWDTTILTPMGKTSIFRLKAGDSILTFDQATARVMPSTVLINMLVLDVPFKRMRIGSGDSLLVGKAVKVGTGPIENVKIRPYQFALFRRLLIARIGAGTFLWEKQWSCRLPEFRPRLDSGSLLVTQNGLPFFANGLIVRSLKIVPKRNQHDPFF